VRNVNKLIAAFIVVVLPCITNAQTTLRALAEARGRYIGSAANGTFYSNPTVPANYKQVLAQEFNILVAENEMKMDALLYEKNTYNWSKADALIAFAETNKMRVRGHCLAWHSQTPSWMAKETWTRTSLLALLKSHVTAVVTRYKGRVHEWDVVNEAVNDNNPANFRGQGAGTSIWYSVIGADFIDSAFVWAHAADPSADLYYNDYNIEYGGSKNTFILNLVKGLKQRNIPITGVGMQAHLEHNLSASRISVISKFVDSLAKYDLKGQITELDLGIPQGTVTAATLKAQAASYAMMMDLFLSKPNMQSFVMWGFTDRYTWLTAPEFADEQPLIFDANLNKKSAYDSLVVAFNRHPALASSSSAKPSSSSAEPSSSSAKTSSSSVANSSGSNASSSAGTSHLQKVDARKQTSIYWGHALGRIVIPQDGYLEVVTVSGMRLQGFRVEHGETIDLSTLGIAPGGYWTLTPER